MATEQLTIDINERGGRTVKRVIDDIGGAADRATRGIYLFQRALFALGVGGAVTGLVRMVDSLNLMENRLRLTTNSTRELEIVQKKLFDVAQRSRSSLEGTAEIYNRMALSAKGLGLETQDLIDVTETLNKAAVLSGASTREANAALIQLGQGIASNRLGGDELRSILEQLPFVADIIAKSLGVTRGELRELGSDGKLTADVLIKAFQEAKVEVDDLFKLTSPTIGQSLTNVFTEVLRQFDRLDDSIGISSAVAAGIQLIADSMNVLLPIVFALTAAFAGFLADSFVARLSTANSALLAYTAGVQRGNVVILGSATAIKMKTQALVASTAAEVASNVALTNSTRLEVAARAAEVARTQALVTQTAAELAQQRALTASTGNYVALAGAQARATSAATALAGAQAGLAAAQRAVATTQAASTAAIVAQDAALASAFRTAQAQSGIISQLALQFPILGGAVAGVTGAFRALWAVIAANPITFALGALALLYTAFVNQKTITEQLNEIAARTDEYITAIGDASVTASGHVNTLSESMRGLSATQAMIELREATFLADSALLQLNQRLMLTQTMGEVPANISASFQKLVADLQSGSIGLDEFVRAMDMLAVNSQDPRFQVFAASIIEQANAAYEAETAVDKLQAIISVLTGETTVADSGLVKMNASMTASGGAASGSIGPINNMAGAVRGLAADAIKAGNDVLEMAGKFLAAFAQAQKLKAMSQNNAADAKVYSGRGGDPRLASTTRAGYGEFKYDGPKLDANNNIIPEKSKGGAGGGGGGGAAEGQFDLSKILKETELLRQVNAERKIGQGLLQLEVQLKRNLTDVERTQATEALKNLEIAKEMSSILDGLRGPQEQLGYRMAALNDLMKQGAISANEYKLGLLGIASANAQASNTFVGGIRAGLADVALKAQDFGKNVQQWVVGSFESATNAVVEFAKTGKIDIRQFFQDIFANLLKLATNQLFAKLVGGLFGGGAGGGGLLGGLLGGLGSGLPGGAAGGSIMPSGAGSTDSQIVAFKKRPDERVDILTPAQQKAQANAVMGGTTAAAPNVNVAPPNVNVQVVLSGDDVAQAMRGPAGTSTIIKAIQENASTIKRSLA